MMSNAIYTWGYGARRPSDLVRYVELYGATVVDVRYSPASRNPSWAGKRVRELVGANRYLHVRALGNTNYNNDGPIVLADAEAGIEQVRPLLERGPVILMCACHDHRGCHRSTVAEALSAALGALVEHLGDEPVPPDAPWRFTPTTTATGRRAAIYVRVSSTQQEEGTSLETQLERCHAYAAERGYVVDEEHIYREVFSGTELWERPQLTRMREAVRAGDVAMVIAYAIDRLSRDPVHLGVIISEADHAGVVTEFVTEPLDTSPEGELIRFVRGYAAKIEHLKILERSKRGKLARIANGLPLPGRKPLYGYAWADERKTRLRLNPTEAEVVRRIFDLAASGVSLRKIAFMLTEEGIPSPCGHPHWARITISHMVRNPAYTGEAYALRADYTRAKGGNHYTGKARPREDWRPLPEGVYPPLVDGETWDEIQRTLATNRQPASRNCQHPEDYLLRGGFARCGNCGSTMVAGKANGLPAYRCGRANRDRRCSKGAAMYASLLDEAVWARVVRVLLRPEIVAVEVARLQEHDPSAADLDAVDSALA
jgi:site-specific DNA recombinase